MHPTQSADGATVGPAGYFGFFTQRSSQSTISAIRCGRLASQVPVRFIRQSLDPPCAMTALKSLVCVSVVQGRVE